MPSRPRSWRFARCWSGSTPAPPTRPRSPCWAEPPPARPRRSGQRLRQVDALAADDRLPRRHEDRAVVAQGADLDRSVGGDQLALGEGLEADHRPDEGEALVLDHMGAQELEA